MSAHDFFDPESYYMDKKSVVYDCVGCKPGGYDSDTSAKDLLETH